MTACPHSRLPTRPSPCGPADAAGSGPQPGHWGPVSMAVWRVKGRVDLPGLPCFVFVSPLNWTAPEKGSMFPLNACKVRPVPHAVPSSGLFVDRPCLPSQTGLPEDRLCLPTQTGLPVDRACLPTQTLLPEGRPSVSPRTGLPVDRPCLLSQIMLSEDRPSLPPQTGLSEDRLCLPTQTGLPEDRHVSSLRFC